MTNEFGFEIPLVSEQECKLQERIENLEKEKCELLGIIQGKDTAIKDFEWQLKEVLEDNDNYQKENETLKKQLEALSGDIPWNELKDVSEVTKKLTEAKDLLKKVVGNFYYLCEINNFSTSYECLADTEQFLSEVEK